MFWDVYTRLCAKVGKAPNVVAREVCGVKSTGTVTGWKNGAIPRNNVLSKLSEYFGVTVEELKGEAPEQKEKPSTQEGDGLDEQAKAFAEKLMQLDDATRALFGSMLDTAIAEKTKKNG